MAQVDAGEKLYGPFRNGAEAILWRDKQPLDVVISFRPLRNPDVERTLNDFYMPIYMENEEREFALTDAVLVKLEVPTNQKGDTVLKQQELFAAVWSDYPHDGKDTGYCDEWVETYSTLDEATKVCQEWAKEERGEDVRIFVAQGLNLDGEYGEKIASW